MSNMKYPHLFSPFKIGNCEIKNRIVYSPMDTKRDSKNDPFSDATVAYYTERAKGGAGLVVSGVCAVDNGIETGTAMESSFLYPDKCDKQIKKIVEGCHKYGSKFFIQIGFNFGRAAFYGGCMHLVAPSKQPNLWAPEMICRELTTKEVEKIIKTTAETICRFAKQTGCDGVCIVGPYGGYMADQFGNAAFNHRTDRFGGSVENRSRFTAETIHLIKKLCGQDFPVLVRMSTRNHIEGIHKGQIPGEPYVEYGRDIEESLQLARYYVEAGADAFIPANGCYDALYWQYSPMYLPEGLWLDEFEPLTKSVNIPVIGPGRILTPEMAEAAIQDGKVTAVAMGRALLADPQWPNKAKEGKADDIRPCIGCNNGCIGRVMAGLPIMCAVNAEVYNEAHQELLPAETVKKVVIVGAGIGGMETARIAKLRGHNVEIYEKSQNIGGIFNVAAAPNFKHGDERLISWYEKQMNDLKIPIHFDTELTAEDIMDMDADEVVVATGSNPKCPPIKGIEQAKIVYASDILSGKKKVGKKVVIMGAGLIGCETALMLSEDKETDVTIVEMARYVMTGGGALVAAPNLEYMRRILDARANINLMMRTSAISCKENQLTVETKRKGITVLEFDTLVIATGLKSEQSLYTELRDKLGEHVYLCGDAEAVGTVLTAVQSANKIAKTF